MKAVFMLGMFTPSSRHLIATIVGMTLRGVDVQIPDELVVDNKALGFIFARSLRLVHVDVVDQLVEHLLGQRTHFHELADGTDELLPLAFLFAHFSHFLAQLQNLLFQLLALVGIFA